MRRLSLPRLSLLALIAGIGLLLYGSYIPAKAWLAQVLLERAWERRLAGAGAVQPWPWADTVPVARLKQPRLGIDQVVLDGASGRVLAFGPGHVTGSARPGQRGNIVISAHRDTHFRWLSSALAGDLMILETADGGRRRYRVAEVAIHNETETALLDPLLGDQLRLMTCYPFDAVDPGSDRRYVLTALPVPASVL